MAQQVPLDRLLIETDCPLPYADAVSGADEMSPRFVVEVARCLAEIHGVDVEEIGARHDRELSNVFLHGFCEIAIVNAFMT